MRRAKWLALRQQVCQAVEALQHEVTCRRSAMVLVSHPVTAVSCAQGAFSAETVRVRKAAQAIGAAVDVQFDGQLHPHFEGIDSTGVEMWSKRSKSSADDCAHSGAALFLHTSTDCSHSFQCCGTSALAQVFSNRSTTVSNRNIHSTINVIILSSNI